MGAGLHFPRVWAECFDAAGFPNLAPINVWVISGPYILVGVAEIFTVITSLEYAFTKVKLGSIHLIPPHIDKHLWLISHFPPLSFPLSAH